MSEYPFYASTALKKIKPADKEYLGVGDPAKLYALLMEIFSSDTCAPRMRDEWNVENKTLGHCSITSFLVQDIFGGEVYGVPLGDGNYHCFNVVDDAVFDLTSEQFGDKKLDYSLLYPQSRKAHFAKKEKCERYLLLKKRLNEKI
ncbi:MAG: hypothetical protein K5694_05780 [Bacilli bacterium]|nr:hypothetical protein [Bacilli bacterium]